MLKSQRRLGESCDKGYSPSPHGSTQKSIWVETHPACVAMRHCALSKAAISGQAATVEYLLGRLAPGKSIGVGLPQLLQSTPATRPLLVFAMSFTPSKSSCVMVSRRPFRSPVTGTPASKLAATALSPACLARAAKRLRDIPRMDGFELRMLRTLRAYPLWVKVEGLTRK